MREGFLPTFLTKRVSISINLTKIEISEKAAGQSMPATIRRLIESDRNDIEEMSRHTWDGHDYLSAVADEWLKDPKCHFYGVEADNHIVAVGNLRLIEDGRTGWMEGLRVHLEYRGKGFAKEITRYLVKKAEHMGIHRLRYTTADENVASLKLAKMAGFSKVLEMAVLWSVNPRTVPLIQGYPAIEETSPATTYDLLKTNPDMIPHGILFYDWKALDSNLQNLQAIGKNHHFYTSLKDEKVDSVSFGYPRPEPGQTWWSFTIYANDSDGFRSQLSHNMAIALERGFRLIMGTFENRFEKTLSQMDFGSEEQGTAHMILLEKQVQSHKRQQGSDRASTHRK